jgi:2-polyprenyl-6-methoxyphenol hydroxylase-like FAD-dependent oxidoreductase
VTAGNPGPFAPVVLIAGAGPVGLTLAADLAWRGIRCVVVDPQEDVHPHPRAISIGVRSMEHFRRLGLDQRVIDAGVPRGRALDVVYTTRMLGREIFRFRIPSIDRLGHDRAALARGIPEIAASPYYKTWTAQTPLERMLRRHLQSRAGVGLRFGWRLDRFEERAEGVRAWLREDATGRTEELDARYLVGCDGANSTVRGGLGIRLQGRGTLGTARGLYFRAPQLDARLGGEPGVMYWVLAPGCGGVIYTVDGGDEWVFNRYLGPGETHGRAPDDVALIHDALGARLDIEILSAQEWLPRQLVAERYGGRRVFLAGDACHLFVPTGGFGMNTGIGDAVDLAWKIAAVEAGWGGPALLASYDAERRPVGFFNTREAADNYDRSGELFNVPSGLEEEGHSGAAARAAVAARLPPKIKHFAPIGVHLGYRYDGSPLIVPDGTPLPAMETATYRPTARPGHRAPHAWLGEGRSTLDLFGRGFVLLRFGRTPKDASSLAGAALAATVPLTVVDVPDPEIAALYERALVLVRPDGHVAWRGDALPADAAALVVRISGRPAP